MTTSDADLVAEWGTFDLYDDDDQFSETWAPERSNTELEPEFGSFQLSQGDPEQTRTPPQSHNTTPASLLTDDLFTSVQVSTSFFPGAHYTASDLVLRSTDAVLFYVHTRVLLRTAEHIFSSVLAAPLSSGLYCDTIVAIPENSDILNVILHFLYNEPYSTNAPSFEDTATSITQMPFYGIEPKLYVIPSNECYLPVLAFAPLFPLELYALAAQFDLYDLAVSTSSHLLAYPLFSITDDMAASIGAVYLKRLFDLHVSRLNALKSILLQPPYPHPPTTACNFKAQKQMSAVWATGIAHLAWSSGPDTSVQQIEEAFSLEEKPAGCTQCQDAITDRLKDVVARWVSVHRTIVA